MKNILCYCFLFSLLVSCTPELHVHIGQEDLKDTKLEKLAPPMVAKEKAPAESIGLEAALKADEEVQGYVLLRKKEDGSETVEIVHSGVEELYLVQTIMDMLKATFPDSFDSHILKTNFKKR